MWSALQVLSSAFDLKMHRQYVNKRIWMCSNKTLFMDPEIWILQHIILFIFSNILKMLKKKKKAYKIGSRPDLALRLLFASPNLDSMWMIRRPWRKTIDGVY